MRDELYIKILSPVKGGQDFFELDPGFIIEITEITEGKNDTKYLSFKIPNDFLDICKANAKAKYPIIGESGLFDIFDAERLLYEGGEWKGVIATQADLAHPTWFRRITETEIEFINETLKVPSSFEQEKSLPLESSEIGQKLDKIASLLEQILERL